MILLTGKRQIGYNHFCDELELISDYFEWDINEERFSVRGTMRGRVFCPITAVAFALYGKKYRVNRWQEAADLIGLPRWIARNIAQAADSGLLFNAELENYYYDLAQRVKR